MDCHCVDDYNDAPYRGGGGERRGGGNDRLDDVDWVAGNRSMAEEVVDKVKELVSSGIKIFESDKSGG